VSRTTKNAVPSTNGLTLYTTRPEDGTRSKKFADRIEAGMWYAANVDNVRYAHLTNYPIVQQLIYEFEMHAGEPVAENEY
jgi:hypothetical protein